MLEINLNKTVDMSSPTLADRMKAATERHHRLAERTGVVREILTKKINRETYLLYLRNLYPVYQAIEKDLSPSSQASKILSPFLNEMLHRTRSIERDLNTISGDRSWKNLALLKASEAYSDHINNQRIYNPVGLLGHIYVRYLGDMNGGQVLELLLKHSLNLPNDAFSFYRYPAVVDIESFRGDYREMFNLSGLSDADDKLIIDTAIKAFEFNIALSNDVFSFVNS